MKNNKKMEKIVLLLLITFSTFTIFNVSAKVTDVREGSGVKVNTTVVDHYTDVDVEDDINLEKDKDFIIDFTKTDNLSKGLIAMSDLEKTIYYKVNNDKLELTENINEAVIKIAGNKEENKAVMTLINTDKNILFMDII